MKKTSKCGCGENEFDPQEAYKRLARSHNMLMETVSQYMSEAPSDRSIRNNNAQSMASALERIVGGKKVKPGDYAECCLIGNIYPNGYPKYWYCTGTLIHPRVVVTAEHCMSSLPNAIGIGIEDQNQIVAGSDHIVKVINRVIHPSEDVALLLLAQKASATPVSVASSLEMANAGHVTLAGFGNDDLYGSSGFGIKREVEVGITALRTDLGQDMSAQEIQYGFNSHTEFVAGRKGLEMDSCNGDSGGPAYIDVKGERKVCGATSRATSEWEEVGQPCGHGGVYVRLDAQLEWIDQTILSWGL